MLESEQVLMEAMLPAKEILYENEQAWRDGWIYKAMAS